MASNTTIREPWGGGPDERLSGMANGMLEPSKKKEHPSRQDIERMESPASHDNISPLDPSNDQWDDLGYPKDTPAPAARQSSARVDVEQRERSRIAEAPNPWRIGLKSTISQDLSRQDKDHGSKLQYLQKRLDRVKLRSLHRGEPHDGDLTDHSTANREGRYLLRNRDQLGGSHKKAK